MGALDLLYKKDTNELDELAARCLLRTAEQLSFNLPSHLRDKLWQLIDADFKTVLGILSRRAEEYRITILLRNVALKGHGYIKNELYSEVIGYLLDCAPLGYPEVKIEGEGFLLHLVADHCLNKITDSFSKPPISQLDPFYLYAFYVFTLRDGITEVLSQIEGKACHFTFGKEDLTVLEIIEKWKKHVISTYPKNW